MKMTYQHFIVMHKIIIFSKITFANNVFLCAEVNLYCSDNLIEALKGHSHKKVDEIRV
jgi:hypothetical protein